MSICSGAFALALAGVLDGAEATTHWQYAPLLQRRFSSIRVVPDLLYTDNGQVLTGAGAAAGFDICLHLIRLNHGGEVANSLARRLLTAPHRVGGQAQFIEATATESAGNGIIADVISWTLENLSRPLTVSDLSERAHMAKRTFVRHFYRHTGTSPAKWIINQRIMASTALLESGSISMDKIAKAVGFGNSATFRQHFSRVMKTSPSAYRRAFKRNG